MGQYVFQQQRTDLKLLGERRRVDFADPLGQLGRRRLLDELFGRTIQLRHYAGGDLVAFRVDPGGIQGIVAGRYLEESGRLDEGRLAESGHLPQLLAIAERPVLQAVFTHSPGGKLVQAGDVSQQGRTGRVDVHAHVVDARFDHLVQRRLQVLGLDVVLVETDSNVGRVDLDQLAQRVLQPPSDRDRAPQDGVIVGEFLASHATGRVMAGAGLVDDHVGQALVLEFLGKQPGEEILSLAAGGTVSNSHHRELEPLDQIGHGFLGRLLGFRLADKVDHVVSKHVAELVQGDQLASALISRIDGQHAAVPHRRLQQ